MISLHVVNETSPLKAVVVGTARSSGPTPKPEEAYDPKSLQHILAGTYPLEADMIPEMDGLAQILQKYGVTVYRPELLENYIQIFARDIAFVIEDKLFHAHTVSNRAREYDALTEIIAQIAPNKIIEPPKAIQIEGGDVILWNDYIFIGTYALRGLHACQSLLQSGTLSKHQTKWVQLREKHLRLLLEHTSIRLVIRLQSEIAGLETQISFLQNS